MKTVVSKDGTSIAYDRSGEGPAVILVGGALSDRSAAAPLAALLAPHFTVFAYDRRGRGDSGDTPPYVVQREVEDMGALIQEAGGSALVFGMSSGAVLALGAARSLAITKLALYEPPFIVDGSRRPVKQDFLARLTKLLAEGRRGEAVEHFMTEAVGVPAETLPRMRQAPMWPALERRAHTLTYDTMIMGDNMAGNGLPPERWASVRAPTLVIDGGASPAWAGNAVQALVNVLPNARRLTLKRQTHGVAPEALAPVLVEFFSGRSVPGSADSPRHSVTETRV